MNYFYKQPSEVFVIAVDFVQRLATGETITSKTVTAIELKHNADKTSTVIDSFIIDGTAIDIKVKAGTDGISYKITIKAVTSGSNTLEEEVIMYVVEE